MSDIFSSVQHVSSDADSSDIASECSDLEVVVVFSSDRSLVPSDPDEENWEDDELPVPVPASDNVPNPTFINVARPIPTVPGSLRPIIIDGNNIAIGHGQTIDPTSSAFSARGLRICVDFFVQRGHTEVLVFVPRYRMKTSFCIERYLLFQLEREGHVRLTPSRDIGHVSICSYDDMFMVQYAQECGGIVVSNDNFKDIYDDYPCYRTIIEKSVLQYVWVTKDCLMFPNDPQGRHAWSSLDDLLSF